LMNLNELWAIVALCTLCFDPFVNDLLGTYVTFSSFRNACASALGLTIGLVTSSCVIEYYGYSLFLAAISVLASLALLGKIVLFLIELNESNVVMSARAYGKSPVHGTSRSQRILMKTNVAFKSSAERLI
jgi:hypothetical protein